MNEREEQIYLQGQKQVYISILMMCLGSLGITDPDARRHAWIEERQAAIVMLRDLCNEFGDNDWPDELYLGDIIEKHLARHLWQREDGPPDL
jgi:hypothetical protein